MRDELPAVSCVRDARLTFKVHGLGQSTHFRRVATSMVRTVDWRSRDERSKRLLS